MTYHRVTIIIGDLNMSKINWLTLTSPNDKTNRPFLDSMVEHGFRKFVNFPTHICNNSCNSAADIGLS